MIIIPKKIEGFFCDLISLLNHLNDICSIKNIEREIMSSITERIFLFHDKFWVREWYERQILASFEAILINEECFAHKYD